MVQRIVHMFTREIGSLHQAAYLLAFFTFLSQVLGLVRDRIFAHEFGASVVLDVYYAAFRIPDIVLVIGASIVSIAILVPYLTGVMAHSEKEARATLDTIFTFFFSCIVCVSLIVYACIPFLSEVLFPGLVEIGKGEELIRMTRILMLSPILLGLSNLFASIVQVKKKFFVYALAPLMYNCGIILGAVLLYPLWGSMGLALGVVMGAFLHMGIQIPAVLSSGLMPRVRYVRDWLLIRSLVITSLPRAFTLSTAQLAILVLMSYASRMPEGAIAVFNFSFNIHSVPLGLIGVSYSLAAFPTLSKFYSEGKLTEFVENVATTLRHIIFWSFPAIILFIVLRAQIVRTLLGSGAFDWAATRLTAASLAILTFSVIAQSFILLFVRGYYASGDTRKPFFINTLSALFIMVSGYVFIMMFERYPGMVNVIENLLRVEQVPGTEMLMLSLAFTTGMIINAVLLWWRFERDFGAFPYTIRRSFFQGASASIVMGYCMYQSLTIFDTVFNISTLPGIFLQGAVSGLIGLIVWCALLVLLGNSEIIETFEALKKRLWKVTVVPPGADTL